MKATFRDHFHAWNRRNVSAKDVATSATWLFLGARKTVLGGTPRVLKTGKCCFRRVSFAYEDQMGCNDAAHAVARTESTNWARTIVFKLKNHCQNRPKFAPNFGDVPYVVYCDL